jgi:membrane fusion protein (multidrug efflux system)
MKRFLIPLSMAVAATLLLGCSKQQAPKPAPPPAEVSALTVHAREVPIVFEFVGQTESSQQVEIRARVAGFLEKRVYTEGTSVKPGQVMFLMDRKPFDASLQAAKAELAQQQARLTTARANLTRVKPLVADNALSAKDLDDATGQEQGAAAAVEAARAKVTDAQLNLSYTTITSPVGGLSSFAKVQDGAYVDVQNSLLTYVAKLDPIRVNFSLSENETLRARADLTRQLLKSAPRNQYVVDVVLADGSVFPTQGRITFADASFSQETGTFLIRAEIPNPKGELRPGQFVRVKVHGFSRPNSIVVPQAAVQEGPRGSFVWLVDKDGKAAQRNVQAGQWIGDNWLITDGLKDGDRVIVDGVLRVAPGAPLKVVDAPPMVLPPMSGASAAPPAGAASASGDSASVSASGVMQSPSQSETTVHGTLYFAEGSARLDAAAQAALKREVARLRAKPAERVALSGYVNSDGDPAANVVLAKERAVNVRNALMAAGVKGDRIELRTPADIIGGNEPAQARRVDIIEAGTP